MKKAIAAALLALGLASFAGAAEAPASPDGIRPLLIGAAVPDVTLPDVDGEPVKLRDLGSERAVLIFYRGGW